MLSDNARRALEIACPQKRDGATDGAEIAEALDNGFSATPAADPGNIGATSNLVGVDGTGSNAAPLAGTESRLDVIEAKIDALMAAMRTAGLLA